MGIAKKGGYSGSKSAKDMAPPAKSESETIKPFSASSCRCHTDVEESPDSPYVAAMRRVEARRALIADVDLPAEYAKAAASVTRELLEDLEYARADARHWHQGWEAATRDVERQRGWLSEVAERAETAERQRDLALLRERAAREDAATHAEREGIQEAKAREFARQAREGESLRRKVRALVNAPEGWHEYNAPNSQGDIVKHHVAFTTTDTLRAVLEDDGWSVNHIAARKGVHFYDIRHPDERPFSALKPDGACFCGKPMDEHPPGPPCPPPPPPGVMHG